MFFQSFDNQLLWFVLIFAITYNAKGIYFNILIRIRIRQGKELPTRLKNSPTHQTSYEFYRASLKKFEQYINEALNNHEKLEVSIGKDDVNHLYLRGTPVNKYSFYPEIVGDPMFFMHKNEYLYFDIDCNGLSRTSIRYPDLSGKGGVWSQTELYNFEKVDTEFKVTSQTIEVNGRNSNSIIFRVIDIFPDDLIEENLSPLKFLNRISYIMAYPIDELLADLDVKLEDVLSILERIESIKVSEQNFAISIARSQIL